MPLLKYNGLYAKLIKIFHYKIRRGVWFMKQNYAAVGLCEFCDTHLKRAKVEIKEKQYEVCQHCAEGIVETKTGALITRKLPNLRPTKENV